MCLNIWNTEINMLEFSQLVRKFPRLLWKLKVHRHVRNNPQLAFNLTHIHPVHALLNSFFKIYFNIILPSGLFLSKFPTKPLHANLFSAVRVTCIVSPYLI